MRKRFVIYSVIISLISILLMLIIGLAFVSSLSMTHTKQAVTAIVNAYADTYDGDLTKIKKRDDGVRITLFSSSGEVLSDTETNVIAENYADCGEITAAIEGAPKVVVRDSDTWGAITVNYAVRVDVGDDYIIVHAAMVAMPVSEYLIIAVPLSLAVMAFAVVLCIVIGYFWKESITKPFEQIKESLNSINNGKFVRKIPANSFDEINQILVEINEVGEKLEKNVSNLKEETTKLDFILNNINDAVVAVDRDHNICLINSYACAVFDCSPRFLGSNINCIGYNKRIFDAINDSIATGQNAVFETELDESVYLVTVKALNIGSKKDDDTITALILSDITSAKKSEKMRSEFFANASHEMKSPLTAIIGFAEIASMENKNEKLDMPLARIANESGRLLTLIEAMLRLSKLENSKADDRVEIDLVKVAREVVESLTPLASDKNVSIMVSGGGCVVAEHEHIYELIKNLAENAVKYNKIGGGVDINISQSDGVVRLKVVDTGIGVTSADQSRIFERFYRVSKSRSRATGGTGLGLAIVKHICLLYDADITLKSKIGLGTSVSVTFKS